MKKIVFFLILSVLTASSLIAAPKAVVFDFCRVMAEEANRDAMVRFISKSFHFSAREFEKANREKRDHVKRGMTEEEFWLAFAKRKKIRLPPHWAASFKSAGKKAIGINQSMYAL